MIRHIVAAALAFLAFAAPAQAQDVWRHRESGVSVARRIGEMRLHDESDGSGGARQDVAVQFGDGETPVTLYVYRAAYPNPALWYERTRLAMAVGVGAPATGVAPRSFTLGNASAPNGLREDIALSGRFSATSVAIAQVGEWIVKARVSSTRLDRDGVAQRMDALLAALRFESMPTPHPLIVPQPCGEESRMGGGAVAQPSDEAVAAGAVSGIVVMSQSRGNDGLAANPAEWCRMTARMPAELGAVYRRRTGGEWVALVTDAGRSVTAIRLEGGPAGATAATYVTVPGTTSLVGIYEDLPHPDEALPPALGVVIGQRRGIVDISTNPRAGNGRKN